jgi:hypothetical protein
MLGKCAREFGRRGPHIETKRLLSLFRCSAVYIPQNIRSPLDDLATVAISKLDTTYSTYENKHLPRLLTLLTNINITRLLSCLFQGLMPRPGVRAVGRVPLHQSCAATGAALSTATAGQVPSPPPGPPSRKQSTTRKCRCSKGAETSPFSAYSSATAGQFPSPLPSVDS